MTASRRPWRAYLRDAAFLACRAVARGDDRRPVVVMYHRVGPGGVAPEIFEEQVRYVADHFTVTPLQDFPGPPTAERVAVLTFDDGTPDQAEAAAVLDRYGVAGTFFPITGHLDGGGPPASMTAGQVVELAARGHEIGAHTRTHRALPGLGDDEVRREVATSKARLEEVTGAAVTSFAYPKGRWDARVRALVAEAGFTRAVTVDEAAVPAAPDWLALPRVAVQSSTGMVEFRAKLTPALDLYERLRGRRRGS